MIAQGTPIGTIDALIAGTTALAHNQTLVTHHTNGFSRMPCLLLADWYGHTP
ncbi:MULTISPECIES: PIN domain-containing protein [Giesbergeria]|uniref:Type II toxin-antitoxin system VapC family toxin n=1 Tax=Giesbergeria sinuosa TaxID=80883 RepID=A0ABV9QBW0_9BURK